MFCNTYLEPHGVGYFASLYILFDFYTNLARKHSIIDEVNCGSEKLVVA